MRFLRPFVGLLAAPLLSGCCCEQRRSCCAPAVGVARAAAPVGAPPPVAAPATPPPTASTTPALPPAVPPVAPPPMPPSVDRSPQLAMGTFTILGIVLGTLTPVAWATRLSDGTEIWLLSESFVMPSSSATNVNWVVQYQTSTTFGTCADLYTWVCNRPAYKPHVDGKAVRCLEHSTTETWNGSTMRSCP